MTPADWIPDQVRDDDASGMMSFVTFFVLFRPTEFIMDRRELLRLLTGIVGASLSAPVAAAILAGCESPPEGTTFVPRTLSPDQLDLVASLAERIIPETDTPGARAARVHEFVDLMLSDWYPEAGRDRFLSGLAELDQSFRLQNDRSFAHASLDEQTAFLEPLDAEAAMARRLAANQGAKSPGLSWFATMKELTVVGYYTSEIGATQELRHQMIFSTYDGDVPYRPGDRAWAD